MLKKVLSLTLALVLCLGILAGCQQEPAETTTAPTTTAPTSGNSNETTAPTEPATLFNAEDNVVIDMWMPNNSDLDTEGCYANLAIEQTINAKVEIFEYEGEAYNTAMAEQKVPPLTYTNGTSLGPEYGPDGAYINGLTTWIRCPM